MNQTIDTKLKLDLACGKNKFEGYTGVDIWEGADIVCNLEEYPWPFADDSVDEIYCSHYIEHVPDLVAFTNELYRIMKIGATASILAPYYSSIRAWQDPTHVRAISEATFYYFNKEWRVQNNLDHYPITSNFDFKFQLDIDKDWCDKDESEKSFAIRHYINVVSNIYVILTKQKNIDNDLVRYLIQAKHYWENGNHELAVENCHKFFDSGENNIDLRLMLAQDAFDANSYDAAVEHLLKAIACEDDSLQGHMGLIKCYRAMGKAESATLHIEALKFKHPDLADSITSLLGSI